MTDFVHLHVHTEYSLLDGACRINELIAAAKSQGQTALAITDHGVMYGAVDFYKAAKKENIKPIIGCEVYVSPRTRFDKTKEFDSEYSHLVLLCKNDEGYRNLITMVSRSFTEGFYSKPRVDEELLERFNGGLIALSGCLSGELSKAILNDDFDSAKKYAEKYEEIFGKGNFYIEIQDHGISAEQRVLPQLIRLSKETGIPLAATNDVHYVCKDDARIQKILVCIGTNHTVTEKTGLDFDTDEFYLKSGDQMAELFPSEAIENTAKIAGMCNFDFEFGNTKLPFYDIGNQDHSKYLRELSFTGATRIYGDNIPQAVTERLNYELGVIERMGYVDYFLIVSDFVRYAKSKKIPVGPGRGSGAASMVAYCIQITGIDPLKHNLLFERFLNPERVSMPDFDIDFCYVRRSEVIEYVISKYGSDHVAQIVTFGTMAARAAVRDVGRAMDIPYAVCDRIAKQIPQELKVTIQAALEKSPELKAEYDSDTKVKELIDTARKVEGMPRHASTHAAGVVITDKPVDSYVPLATNEGSVVTQYTMTALDELGLLKMDFLGLRNLTVIDDTVKMVRKYDPSFDIEKIPPDDPETMKMMSAGLTEGVFQFESGGMKSVLQAFGPEKIEDLIAIISLYRPGPMDSIPKYIENRHHPEKIKYETEFLRPILDVTYGCIVYQEQVMQVFRTLAGYSLGRADIVRRAMAKKKHDVMEKERSAFIYGENNPDGTISCEGCVKRGVPANAAEHIFDEMSAFSSYAFNKSHAAAYAYVAYRTAYLKCHREKEYMAALLTSVLENSSKFGRYIAECRKDRIKILPPDVNESGRDFTAAEGGIRFGLLAIRNIGGNLVESIIKERENKPFSSVLDFFSRLYGNDLNRRAAESLVLSGAMDTFGCTRRQLLQGIEQLMRFVEARQKYTAKGQLDLFGTDNSNEPEFVIPFAEEMPERELLKGEKEVTGMYISGHPLGEYSALLSGNGVLKSFELGDPEKNKRLDGKHSVYVGMVTNVRQKTVKSGQTMLFVTAEDMYGDAPIIVFPKLYERDPSVFKVGEVLHFEGRVSVKESGEADFIAEKADKAKKAAKLVKESEKTDGKHPKRGLYLRVTSFECNEYKKARRIMDVFDGDTPVIVRVTESGKAFVAPKKEWVMMNGTMMRSLTELLGKDNVIFVE